MSTIGGPIADRRAGHRASRRRANIPLAKLTPDGRRNQTPDATAADNITPYVTRAALSAVNTEPSSPVAEKASQPPPAAMTIRTSPADNGHNSRPAPCEAK